MTTCLSHDAARQARALFFTGAHVRPAGGSIGSFTAPAAAARYCPGWRPSSPSAPPPELSPSAGGPIHRAASRSRTTAPAICPTGAPDRAARSPRANCRLPVRGASARRRGVLQWRRTHSGEATGKVDGDVTLLKLRLLSFTYFACVEYTGKSYTQASTF